MAIVRLQSAMEYLMTYGWAILIIAVVLGALFGLGFFNAANLAPKVSAGSCQVYRPNGPGTTSFINLEGTCNNELPQYVAYFPGGFTATYIDTGYAGLPWGTNSVSIFAWIYVPNAQLNTGVIIDYGATNLGVSYDGGHRIVASSYTGATVPSTGWHFVGFTSSPTLNQVSLYVDGVAQTFSGTVNSGAVTASRLGGSNSGCGNCYIIGDMANIQVYNTSLSANEVTALYDEGIGGVPILTRNLVAWWPLNGNANDYSGNLNNGVPANGVTYTGSWTSSYTAP